ncbi:DUF6252 family protein [Hymenobacter sp. BRD67]|uniref:DUF6252 family protein n=1 Tax=Hymenobacter sp. BRD67 TaxID=2675877 RepID=UPI00156704D3|nr:DUF6252 family protein [Hymenobacter sp. BRD67]QKG51647.1 hypothetical protein GKZ67_02345 [Hymenobacter sp. BRD67]
MGSLLLLLTGCSLTSKEIEPALPVGRIDNSDTLVYYANGLPVVANNHTDLGTVIGGIFSGSSHSRPVEGELNADNSCDIYGADEPSDRATGAKAHELTLHFLNFKGVGTYQLNTAFSSYQEYILPYLSNQFISYSLDIAAPGEVTITAWDSTNRHLQGTFQVLAIADSGKQQVALTAGSFDLVVGP